MTPFPLNLHPPGARLVSTLANRTPERLLAIVAEHHLRGHGRYTPRDVTGDGRPETWCNLFAQDIAEAMSSVLPRYTRANELLAWLPAEGREFGWEQVPAHVAQRMADVGQLALAGWASGDARPGHLAVLVPSLGEPGTWVAQAGAANFTRGRLEAAFGTRPVVFFAHP